jgi:integrase
MMGAKILWRNGWASLRVEFKGRREQRSLFTQDRRIAEAARKEAERRIRLGLDPFDAPSTGSSFAQFAADWLEAMERAKKLSTFRQYDRAVREALPILGSKLMHQITRADAYEVAQVLARGGKGRRGPTATLGLLAGMQSLFTRAGEELLDPSGRSLVPTNPFERKTKLIAGLFDETAFEPDSDAEIEAHPDPYSAEEQKRIRYELELDLADRCKVLLGDGSGLRAGEVFGVWWTDLDLELATVRVRRTVDMDGHESTVKTRRSRRAAPLNGPTIEALRRLRAERGTEFGPVFRSRRPPRPAQPAPRQIGYESRQKFLRRFKYALEHAEIEVRKHPFHRLRHTFCARLLSHGVEPWKVSKWAGHRSKEFTEEVYSRWLPDAVHVEEVNRGL